MRLDQGWSTSKKVPWKLCAMAVFSTWTFTLHFVSDMKMIFTIFDMKGPTAEFSCFKCTCPKRSRSGEDFSLEKIFQRSFDNMVASCPTCKAIKDAEAAHDADDADKT